jgi:hypothetical protein
MLKKKKYHFGIQCLVCKDRIFSYSVHDFKMCRCGEVFVDGGSSYFKWGFIDKLPKRIRHTERLDGKWRR